MLLKEVWADRQKQALILAEAENRVEVEAGATILDGQGDYGTLLMHMIETADRAFIRGVATQLRLHS